MNYHAALAHFPQITYRRYERLIRHFQDLSALWGAELGELVAASLDPAIADAFISWRETTPVEKLLANLERLSISTVSINEPIYPRLLKEINDPAHTLFIRGTLQSLATAPAVAVVGTRRLTSYGRHVGGDITGALASQGVVIVSGLALGIDGVAHEATLRHHGKTIAVLGSGVDAEHIYPSAHRDLAARIIAEGGAVISEYPPGFLPTQYSFPARNRLIAGLTLGTLVVEAPLESGALITAKAALDYNREVFAIPHPITSNTGAGGNRLLQQGATLVTKAEDIIEALQLKNLRQLVETPRRAVLTKTEEIIMNALSHEGLPIDAIVKATGLSSSVVSSQLTMMEMKGLVKNSGGMRYIKLT